MDHQEQRDWDKAKKQKSKQDLTHYFKNRAFAPEQESKQDLTHYYKIIFTLKSGVQVEICSRTSYDESKYEALDDCIVIGGFTKTPLLVAKTIKVNPNEIAAMEQITDPCIAQVIPWPNNL